jgi:hypothetical protein
MNHALTPSLFTLAALITQRLDPQTISPQEWPELVDLAIEHGVAPVLSLTAVRAGVRKNDHPAWVRLAEISRETALRYIVQDRAQSEVNQALDRANIPTIWLKGAALARLVYPKPELRPMIDLDILVPCEDYDRAVGVLKALGYSENEFSEKLLIDKWERKLSHHYQLIGGMANMVRLELHFQFSKNILLMEEQLGWFWDQTQALDHDTYRVLKPEAHLLYLCAHATLQHGEGQLRLLRYLDLHLLILNTPLDWSLVVEQAVRFKWTYAVERALTLTAQFFGTPIPDAVIRDLQDRRPSGEDVLNVVILQEESADWFRAKPLFEQLSTRDRLAVIRTVLLPPPTYMRSRYDVEPGKRLLPYYLHRWGYQLRTIWQWTIRPRLWPFGK